jgi:ribosome-associated protein
MTDIAVKSSELVELAASAASDKKAQDIIIMDMRTTVPVTDYFLIAGANSTTQVRAIADAIEDKLEEAGQKVIHKEGYREGHWILLDYGNVVAHIFVNDDRRFYNIEQLWADAPSRNFTG